MTMWATVRRYEGVTEPEEAGRRVAEGFVPLISEMRGFVAYYWFDAGGGVMASTSIFEDRSHEEESNEKAALGAREPVRGASQSAYDHRGSRRSPGLSARARRSASRELSRRSSRTATARASGYG